MRTVEIKLCSEFVDAVGNIYNPKVSQAIGYLSTWAIPTGESHGDTSGRYSGKVSIYGDKDGCLYATYRNLAGEATFHIAAIRHDDGSYTTHS